MTRTLTVQTVRYLNHDADLLRSVASAGHALGRARSASDLAGEVTVAIGDASPDPLAPSTVDALEALGAQYEFTFAYRVFGENTGSARGQNTLAREFPATWQYVSNPDVIFGGTALAELWRRTNDDEIGILEARQLPLEMKRDYDPVTGSTSWADGSCSLVRGDLWRKINGYDETFFLYGDDVDMSWRVRLAGYRVVHVSSARVFHDKRVTTTGALFVPEHERYYSAIAAYLMARKWGSPQDVDRSRERIVGVEFADVRDVIAEYDAADTYPPAMPGASSVAEFTDNGSFGRFRW
jgi:GT2 family glycosyltransferase